MMNQTTVKPWKTTPVPVHTAPVHTAYCNFKHFKFAVQNSQIAIQKMILLCKFLFCITVLLCKKFPNEIFSLDIHVQKLLSQNNYCTLLHV